MGFKCAYTLNESGLREHAEIPATNYRREIGVVGVGSVGWAVGE